MPNAVLGGPATRPVLPLTISSGVFLHVYGLLQG